MIRTAGNFLSDKQREVRAVMKYAQAKLEEHENEEWKTDCDSKKEPSLSE
jgi:hypothetical protein